MDNGLVLSSDVCLGEILLSVYYLRCHVCLLMLFVSSSCMLVYSPCLSCLFACLVCLFTYVVCLLMLFVCSSCLFAYPICLFILFVCSCFFVYSYCLFADIFFLIFFVYLLVFFVCLFFLFVYDLLSLSVMSAVCFLQGENINYQCGYDALLHDNDISHQVRVCCPHYHQHCLLLLTMALDTTTLSVATLTQC